MERRNFIGSGLGGINPQAQAMDQLPAGYVS